MKRISKQRILNKIIVDAKMEPILYAKDCVGHNFLQFMKPGKMIEGLNREERDILKTCTAEDFR